MSTPATRWQYPVLVIGTLTVLAACGDSTSPRRGCLDEAGNPLPLQPESLRVDRGTPVFTSPTTGTNPLFPVDQLTSYLQLGTVDGQPFRAGPAATIMPGNPAVGNVSRPENSCGVVFEEVVVTATGVTVSGPTGPVNGAIEVTELHQDGMYEDKTFAPGHCGPALVSPGSEQFPGRGRAASAPVLLRIGRCGLG